MNNEETGIHRLPGDSQSARPRRTQPTRPSPRVLRRAAAAQQGPGGAPPEPRRGVAGGAWRRAEAVWGGKKRKILMLFGRGD